MYLNDDFEGGQTGFTVTDPLSDEDLGNLSPEIQPYFSSHKANVSNSALKETLGRDEGLEMAMFDTCHTKRSVKPKKLNAVLFYNTDSNMVLNDKTLHTLRLPCAGGCQVESQSMGVDGQQRRSW
jgi:hypothetical protein